MTLPRRRLYLVFLAIVFLAIGSILLGLATGYRFDFSERRIVLTGSLSVESDPRDATIELNGTPVSDRTPARLTGLPPGDYAVRLSKSGYHPFEKSVSILARRAVSIDRVTLFRNEAPVILAGLPAASSVSPLGRYAIVSDPDGSTSTAAFVDVDRGERTPIPSPNGRVTETTWSPDGLRAAITFGVGDGHETLLISAERPSSPVRLDQSDITPRRVVVTDTAVFVLDAAGTLVRIGSNLERSVLGTGVRDAVASGSRSVVTIEADGEIRSYTEDSFSSLGRPAAPGRLVEAGEDTVVLSDDSSRETVVYVVADGRLQERAKLPAAVHAVRPNESGDALLLTSVDASLLERRGKDRLLFRSTHRVVDAAWLDRQHAVVLLATSLLALDLTQTQPTTLLDGITATAVRALQDGRRVMLQFADGSLAILAVR